jgi:putative ABC transport system permease protein
MKTVAQMLAVTALNLRALAQRRGNSLVIVLGTAGVVAVLISVLSMSSGFRRTIEGGGQPDRAIVQSRGVFSDVLSAISRENVRAIAGASGISQSADGKPLLSAEVVMMAPVIRKSDGSDAFVTLRGVGEQGFLVRNDLHLVAGRLPRSGIREVIVGAGARAQFSGLDLGDRVQLGDGDWAVVGVFASNGSAHESSVIADAETMVSAYRLQVFNIVVVRLASVDSLTQLKDSLAAIPGLDVQVVREPDYLAAASLPINRMINLVAYAIGAIMAVGALFGALNTMYSAVSVRSAEIATLRAIGFNGSAVVASVLVESLILALAGAAVGVVLAYAMLNGRVISTTGSMLGNNTQVIYALSITTDLVLVGVALACAVGFLGGLFPAVRAARLPVATALRAK